MNNKVLINLYVPEVSQCYDIYIPVNEVVWKVVKLITKVVSDFSGGTLPLEKDYILINRISGKIYKTNEIILDTDIKNATKLILLSNR